MDRKLQQYAERFDSLARSLGLDYFPVDFELVPDSFMMEIAVYGLPVRMPHWSFGTRYIYQLVQHRMGNSRLFEVVFPGNPGRAYLAKNNNLPENTLVFAHVLGHADFSKNNALFKRSQEQVGYKIVERAASHAQQIEAAIEEHGQQRVEAVLDAALALEQHIDLHKGVHRRRYSKYIEARTRHVDDTFRRQYDELPGEYEARPEDEGRRRSPIPPNPERDLLWFLAHYTRGLEGWERDICLAVREESFYFYPVFACQIMNEGWASYWHARLLREADFLPNGQYVDAIKTHSDVVRPYAGENQVSLSINPYHLGFKMWDGIIEREGIEHARELMQQDDDFSFIRNHLTTELAEELNLFQYRVDKRGAVKVIETDVGALHETILAPKYNFGAPSIAVEHVGQDGTLELRHDHEADGRGLDLGRAQKVLEYIRRIWKRPVTLHTAGTDGTATLVSTEAAE